MAGEWVIPIGKKLYKHREELLSIWKRTEDVLFGKKNRVAITGVVGGGKTVLLHHLTGEAYRRGYTPPYTSQHLEVSKFTAANKRLQLFVVPGQESRERIDSLRRLFASDEPVVGIIHVVPNGFVTLRGQQARNVLINDYGITNIDKLRAHFIKQELADLDETCTQIRSSISLHGRPNWMLVTVSKIDLYPDELEAAEAYYSPHAQSPFTDKLTELRRRVGTDSFRWDVLPVCTWLEDFEWNGLVRQSKMSPAQRDALVARFSRRLEQFCAS